VQPATDTTKPGAEKSVSRFAIDAGRSTFTVQAFSTGILSAFGHNPRIAIRGMKGDVQFSVADGMVSDVHLHVEIDPRSLEVTDDISDKDRREIHRQMYDEVLEVERYPEIVYDCSSVTINGSGDQFSSTLNGDLTLHGESHPLSVSARITLMGEILKGSGEFTVSQKQFGIAPVTVAGGAIKLKDDVKCTFNLVARKRPRNNNEG